MISTPSPQAMIGTLSRQIVSNTFLMYFQAHSYHWNVEGPDWLQYHTFFGTIYNELWLAVDLLAENIRVIGEYAPISLTDLYKHKSITEDSSKPINITTMVANLHTANSIILGDLRNLLVALEEAKNYGFANNIADRITAHDKYNYMLESILRGHREVQ